MEIFLKVLNLLAGLEYRVFEEETGETLVPEAFRRTFVGNIVALPGEFCD